jgi:hypothetical protein
MPLAQMQREDPPVLDLDVFENVWPQRVVLVIADQPRIAVDHRDAHILGAPDQRADAAAMAPDLAPALRQPGDGRLGRRALGHRRQRAGRDGLLKERRFLKFERRGGRGDGQQAGEQSEHHAAHLTKWPASTSCSAGASSPV